MTRWAGGCGRGFGCVVAAWVVGGCFPPPHLKVDVADGSADGIEVEVESEVEVGLEAESEVGSEVESESEVGGEVEVEVEVEVVGCVEPCTDDDRCTTNDHCEAGACRGTAVVCQAIDDCHDTGACQAASGVCSTPAKTNGTPCDDGNFCTLDDVCSAGFCFGPKKVSWADDYTLGLQSDGVVGVYAITASGTGGAFFGASVFGQSVYAVGSSDQNLAQNEDGTPVCGMFIGETRADGSIARFTPWSTFDDCTRDSKAVPSVGIRTFGDGTVIIAGAFKGPFQTSVGGRTIGLSPTGLDLDEGFFVARARVDGEPMWALTFLGFNDSWDGHGYPRLVTNGSNDIAFGLSSGTRGSLRQIIGNDDSQTTLQLSGNDDLALVYAIKPNGEFRERARFVGHSASVILRSMALLDDGTLLVVGGAWGESVEITTENNDSTLIPTGVHTESSVWVVAIGPDDKVRWWNHLFVAPAADVSRDSLGVVPVALAFASGSAWVATTSVRRLRFRSDEGPGILVSGTSETPLAGGATILSLSADSGALLDANELGPGQTWVTGLAANEGGVAHVGQSLGLDIGDSHVGIGTERLPYIARGTSWAAGLAAPVSGGVAGPILSQRSEVYEPMITSDGTGGFLVAGVLVAPADVGVHTQAGLAPGKAAAYVMRIGSHRWIDCQ